MGRALISIERDAQVEVTSTSPVRSSFEPETSEVAATAAHPLLASRIFQGMKK